MEHAALEEVEHLEQHLLDALLPRFQEVEGPVADARMLAATSSGSRTSVLPISMKRPPRGKSSSDASTNSPARELSTASTPLALVALMNFSLNSKLREEEM